MQDKTTLTIDAYNKNFSSYTEKFMNYSPYAKHVKDFAGFLEDGCKVLDLGCGPGNVAKQLKAEKSIEITGIDLSAEMLEAARVNVPDGFFQLQDSRTVRFPPEYFDGVVLSFSIVHLYDREMKKVLANAAVWLKSGGYLYLSFMEGKQPGFETTSFSSQPLYFNYFQKAAIEELLKEHGIDCFHSIRQDYLEPDGSITADIFIFGKKL